MTTKMNLNGTTRKALVAAIAKKILTCTVVLISILSRCKTACILMFFEF